ncbi:formimidoylglutamate deiminase [Amycolatopsis acidiphila]|uniref:Formimidoylglutamate deiminase n=1 Tax=Amycolatopsis acidiphila TaxID=715473 RepID=A0A558AI41_9PSEU|nr:formimidoylglutamate deiminase [Amycolatopsis acidiphila]TVT23927.1 formimidoylglutamate deiminase [Amycolatopsis acidiphila]UIJ61096.1 formimidoylglutamate deiminase [Amycolatopsis acidiphila]GHG86792.1 formimidoylglutamate deiminase [Amycolatopsis acidiphila]
MTTYWCAYAWLPGGVAHGVRIDVEAEVLTTVTPGSPRAGTVLNGLVVPGFANGHSHAFHRALRGRTHHGHGTFWTWRERMYALAERLDPESCYRLARGVFAEMTLSGYTSVGEFHYLHHAPGGRPYADPNAMGYALAQAATDSGIRLTLLDTCYLTGGFGRELDGRQQRFADADADAWARRVEAFAPDGQTRVGAAVHSVRAVPADQLPVVADRPGPLHVHLSEQRGENEECLAHYGRTPTEVLAEAGVLGPRSVAVHGTHLSDDDIGTLAATGTRVCFCPTTERDLGDGIGPARALADAGVPLCLGSDSHAVVDPFEEARALELDDRLASESRGRFAMSELLATATDHDAIGWGELVLMPGASADLVVVDLGSVRTAGCEPDAVLLAASAADVTDVLVGGRWVVRDRVHQLIDRPETVLAKEIEALWRS